MAGKTMFDAPKVIGLKVSQLISLLGRWPGNLRAVDLEVSSLERRMKQVHRWGWYRWGWVPSRWHGMVVEILTDGPLNLDPWRGPQFWMFAKRNLQHFDFWSFRSNHQKSIWVENLSCILKFFHHQTAQENSQKTLVSCADFLFQDLAMAIPPSEARGVSVVSWDCSDGTLAVDMLPDISGWDLLGVCQNGCFQKMGGVPT